MDPVAFDRLARAFTAAGNRRRLLIRLAAVLPAGGLLPLLGAAAAAPGQRKGQGKGKGKGKGVGRPLDCPDQKILCYRGGCSNLVGSFGPLGMCWNGFEEGCCPCENDTVTYWDNLCNERFSVQCDGNCFAANERLLECLNLTYCG
jgi:hypothetical protein